MSETLRVALGGLGANKLRTDPTPIINPRIVRPVRSLLAPRPPRATRRVSLTTGPRPN
jgi:hypothetical protein